MASSASNDDRDPLPPRSLMAAMGRFLSSLCEFPRDLPRLGLVSSYRLLRADVEYLWRQTFRRDRIQEAPTKLVSLPIPGYSHRVYFRRNTSDRYVVRQIFRERDYDCLGNDPSIRFFVDGGAGIGAASFYLLSKFPSARAIVIEADESNLEVCRRNLGPFNDRIEVVPIPLRTESSFVEKNGVKKEIDQQACSRTSESAGISLNDIFGRIPESMVDLLTLDAACAERQLIEDASLRWLERTRNLLIESVSDERLNAIHLALKSFEYAEERHGMLTVFRNITKKCRSTFK